MAAIPLPDPPLSDGSVKLRPWRGADVATLVAELNENEIARWTTIPQPYYDRDAREFLAQSEALRAEGRSLNLAIEGEADGVLGSIDVRITDRGQGRGELGYLVYRRARGRQAATRAVRLLARWAFDELELARLEIYVQPGNDGSLAVAERAGFVREGLLRSHRMQRGRRADMILLGRLPGDPEPAG